jgi:hypothetical protein
MPISYYNKEGEDSTWEYKNDDGTVNVVTVSNNICLFLMDCDKLKLLRDNSLSVKVKYDEICAINNHDNISKLNDNLLLDNMSYLEKSCLKNNEYLLKCAKTLSNRINDKTIISIILYVSDFEWLDLIAINDPNTDTYKYIVNKCIEYLLLNTNSLTNINSDKLLREIINRHTSGYTAILDFINKSNVPNTSIIIKKILDYKYKREYKSLHKKYTKEANKYNVPLINLF